MSELIEVSGRRNNSRWQLFVTVSTLALLATASEVGTAEAAGGDTSRPTVWIELGGQLERIDGGSGAFVPSFATGVAQDGFTSPQIAQRPARYSNGIEGAISFQPEGSDWSLSAAIRYGRSNAKRHIHQEKPHAPVYWSFTIFSQTDHQTARLYNDYADDRIANNESHTILDFQAGKDVGLGLFGQESKSTVAVGVRFAQFNSKSTAALYARPDGHFVDIKRGFVTATPPKYQPFPVFHDYKMLADATRGFSGIGPAASWDSSSPLAGNSSDAELAFDWGVNVAVLVGRQKATVHHHSSEQYHYAKNVYVYSGLLVFPTTATSQSQKTGSRLRSRTIVVPNLGGFAGVSLKFPNAKVSLGYRADFFFRAMDGGINTRMTYDRDFYGPFATVSVGLGG